MDSVHDLPPGARASHDNLQVLAGTLAGLAALLERRAFERERASRTSDVALSTAREELRQARREHAQLGRPRRRGLTQPTGSTAARPQAPPTSGPAEEEALVLAGLASQRAQRRPATRVVGADAVAQDVGHAAAAPWLARAVSAQRSTARWRTTDLVPQWASERDAVERARHRRERSEAWQRQAEDFHRQPEGDAAAAISRRRAGEAAALAGYWQNKADRIASGGPAYEADGRLAAGLEALAAARLAQANDSTLDAGRDLGDSAAAAALLDSPNTPDVDEHRDGVRSATLLAALGGTAAAQAGADDEESRTATSIARLVQRRLAEAAPSSRPALIPNLARHVPVASTRQSRGR